LKNAFYKALQVAVQHMKCMKLLYTVLVLHEVKQCIYH